MTPSPPLLSQLQRLIESSYDWTTGIQDLDRFVVGDQGYRLLYGGKAILEELPGPSPGARTLITWKEGRIRLKVYYPDQLVRHLESRNPLKGIDEENVIPFSILIEELDHLLMLAWCIRHHRPVRLVELEFHANVTKYLVVSHFLGRLGRRSQLSVGQRQWVREQLFHGIGEDLPPCLRMRYRTAANLASRFLSLLEPLPAMERVRAIRRFARRSWAAQRLSLESGEGANGLGGFLAL